MLMFFSQSQMHNVFLVNCWGLGPWWEKMLLIIIYKLNVLTLIVDIYRGQSRCEEADLWWQWLVTDWRSPAQPNCLFSLPSFWVLVFFSALESMYCHLIRELSLFGLACLDILSYVGHTCIDSLLQVSLFKDNILSPVEQKAGQVKHEISQFEWKSSWSDKLFISFIYAVFISRL